MGNAIGQQVPQCQLSAEQLQQNLVWNEKQQQQANEWSHESQLAQQRIQIQEANEAHTHFLVEHLFQPSLFFLFFLFVAVVVYRLIARSIVANVESNKDDNDTKETAYREYLASCLKITPELGMRPDQPEL